MERYFPPGRTNLVLFPLEYISHQELLEKTLKDRDEVAVLSAVSCFMWRSLTRIQNSTLPWYLWEKLTNFSRRTHKKSGTTSPQFSRKSDLTFLFSIKNRLELWQSILHPVCCGLERLAAITTEGTGADSNRVEKPNGTGNFRNFQISRKKDNLERWTEIFETNFRKISVPFDSEREFPEILVEWNAPGISGRVAKLTFDRWSFTVFEQSHSFSEIADVLFGLCEVSTPSKDHGWKKKLSSALYPEFRGDWTCWREFTTVFLQRSGLTTSSEYPTLA